MKPKELHGMTEGELHDKLQEMHKELMKANAQIAMGTTPQSPGQVRQFKKTIARIKTILHEKQQAQQSQTAQKRTGKKA